MIARLPNDKKINNFCKQFAFKLLLFNQMTYLIFDLTTKAEKYK